MKLKKETILRLFCAVCVTLLIISCSSGVKTSGVADGQRVEWSQVGIGGGGAQFNPEVSPHDANVAFVTCDMGGSFVTYNGGESWRMFNLGCMVRFFVFDPVDPNVVYAQSYGLFKSDDKGLTWNLLYPKASEVISIVSRGDHAGETIVLSDSSRRTVQALAIDPVQSKHLYAAIRINQSIALYFSTDGGKEWTKEKDFEQDVKNIFIDPSSPENQRTLFVAYPTGVHQRVNGQWQSYGVPNEAVRFSFFAGGYDAGIKKYILYGVSGAGYFSRVGNPQSGIFYSDNGGKTWENRQAGLLSYCLPGMEKAEFRALATSANNPATLYISYNGLTIHPDTACIGVAKSEDYGKTWTLPWKDKMTVGHTGDVTSPNYGGDWMDDRFGPEWGENPFNLAVSATNPAICYATDFGRTVKTSNGGKTWEAVYTKQLPDGSWASRGIEVTTGYNIIFDPFDKNHVFIALTDVGLIESKNGGKGWLSATQNNGVPENWINSTYWIVFDPKVKDRVWAAMSWDHDLPRPKMFRNRGIDSYRGGVLLSEDGGTNWKPVSDAIGETALTHLLLDETSKVNARTLYACAFGKGVYKSTDGGLNWVQKNKGIEGKEPFAWRIERRESDGTLFLIVSRRSENGSIGNDQDGALYKSTDGAETWTKMSLPEGCNGPTSIVTTKKYPKRLVLSAWGRPTRGSNITSDVGGGIFISDDEGKTWTQVMDKDQHIHDITFDPRNGRYYACGFNASAYYSEDGSKTWNRIRGFNFKWGKRVEPDPFDPTMVYVITFGGGVWYGPASGDPEATEDILNHFERR